MSAATFQDYLVLAGLLAALGLIRVTFGKEILDIRRRLYEQRHR
jgi:hypothetical protein